MSTKHDLRQLSRRDFVHLAATTTGVVAAGSLAALAGCERDTLSSAPDFARARGTLTRNPLFIPSTVSPSNLTLTTAPGTADLGGGKISNVWTYNGSFPGPTIRASSGDSASILLVNGLSQDTITHWHGMLVNHDNDGHPIQAFGPGGSKAYAFTINQRACLNWYHPHPHMLTGEQVAMGLAGGFVITDAEEAALGLPSGAREIPLIVRDTSLDRAGNLQYTPKSGGFLGNVPLVNGTRDPYLEVDASLYRFRVLAGSNARIFGLALSTGAPFTLIGNDGGLLAAPVTINRIDVAPGERVDLLVDFSTLPVGASVMLRDLRAGWDLTEFRVSQAGTVGSIPGALSTIVPLTGPVTTRNFSFEGMSKINGREYDVNRIDFRVPFGQTERWVFTTKGNAPHPVHVHGASFQVQSRTGGRGAVFPWERGWKDTVLLEDGETVAVLIRFEAFRGLYVMHCHKLEHEDMGMMANFEVV